jgi:hypothetical protein
MTVTKNKVGIFLIILFFKMDAGVVVISDKIINSSNEDQLYRYLQRVKTTGNDFAGETPGRTQQLKVIYDAIGKGPQEWHEAIRLLKQGQPGGSGAVGSGMSGATAAGGQSGVAGTGIPAGATGGIAGAPSAAEVSTDIPTPPGGPEAPPPPPGAPVARPAMPMPIKKEAQVVQLVLPELSVAELGSLSEKDKKQSDERVLEVLEELAKECFIGDQKKVAQIKTKGLKPPVFEDAYAAYRFFVKDRLAANVGLNEQFKKRAEFKTFIGYEDKQGQLFAFMDSNLNISAGLSMLYGQVANNTQSLVQFFKSLMFNQGLIDTDATRLIETFGINVVVSQRPMMTPALAGQIQSDYLVETVFMNLIDAVSRELPAPAAPTLTVEVESTQAAVVPGATQTEAKQRLGSFLQKKLAPETETVEEVEVRDAAMVSLSHDYIDALYDQVNRLRIQPQFFKFAGLIGSVAREAAMSSSNPLDRIKKYPFLETLLSRDPLNFSLNKLKPAIQSQLVFQVEEMEEILRATPALNAMLNDHIERLKNRTKNVDVNAFIAEQVAAATSEKSLMTMATKLQRVVGTRPEINALKEQLKSLSPDVNLIINSLKALSGKQPAFSEAQVRKVMSEYVERQKQKKAVIDLLQAAKTKYAQERQPIDGFLYNEIISRKIVPQKWQLDAIFKAYDREAASILPLFTKVVGAQSVDNIVSKEAFYQWIKPYGLLVKVIEQVPGEPLQVGEGTLDVLLASLRALNTGEVGNYHYVPVIQTEKGLITSGVYKGKLNGLIAAVEAYDIGRVLNELSAFIQNANPGVQNDAKFKEALSKLASYLVGAITGDIVKQLTELDRGSGQLALKGLPLAGLSRAAAVRNAAVYGRIEGLFKPLLLFVTKNGQSLSQTDLSQLNVTAFREASNRVLAKVDEMIQQYIPYLDSPSQDDQRRDIVEAIRTYLNEVAKQLEYLKSSAVVTAPNTPGGADAVSAGIPGAPPPPPVAPGSGAGFIPPPPPPPPF